MDFENITHTQIYNHKKIKTRYCHNLYELVKTCTKFLNRKIGKPIFIVGYY